MASAYLMEPRIAQRCTVIWIGGGSYPNGGKEFNAGNDVLAANVVMESPLPLWQVPKNVYEMMAISFSELEVKVAPKGRLGAYLFNELMQHAATKVPRESAFRTGETWVLGDSPAVGLILYPQRYEYDEIPAPQLSEQQQYLPGLDPLRTIRVYKRIDSRLILEDFFAKLSLYDSTWWKRNT
jgi:inosine-uridine nucleoside N-ribohydrolase